MSLPQSSLQVFWCRPFQIILGFPWSQVAPGVCVHIPSAYTLWTATFFCLWWSLLVWLPIGVLGMVVLLGAMDLVSVVDVVCLVCECGSCECGNCSGFCETRQSNRGQLCLHSGFFFSIEIWPHTFIFVSYLHFCLIFSFFLISSFLSHISIFVSYLCFRLISSFLFYILTLSHIFICSKKDLMRPEQLIDVWHPANTVADYEHWK